VGKRGEYNKAEGGRRKQKAGQSGGGSDKNAEGATLRVAKQPVRDELKGEGILLNGKMGGNLKKGEPRRIKIQRRPIG